MATSRCKVCTLASAVATASLISHGCHADRPRAGEDAMNYLRDFGHLVIGRRYRVVKAFADFDRGEHPVGETWVFEGHSFLPYDDGLSLFVSSEPGRVRQIRMRWAPEDQGPVVD